MQTNCKNTFYGDGDYSNVETPLTIPNREVKHICADSTALFVGE